MWVDVPYDIAPMQVPAKVSFLTTYSSGKICGALVLLDQGISEELDMAYVCTTGRWCFDGGGARERKVTSGSNTRE